MSGPQARIPFDEVMEHVPDASGVTHERGTVGGIDGVTPVVFSRTLWLGSVPMHSAA